MTLKREKNWMSVFAAFGKAALMVQLFVACDLHLPKAEVRVVTTGSRLPVCDNSDCETPFHVQDALATSIVDANGVMQISEAARTDAAVTISQETAIRILGYAIVSSATTCRSLELFPSINPPTVSDVFAMVEGTWNICVSVIQADKKTLLRSPSIIVDKTAPTSTSISITNAAAYTASTAVTLTLAANGASDMYITNASGCAGGGVYEAYSASKSWTLGQTNGTATVYVKFKDLAGNESSCVNDTITHDNTAPVFPGVVSLTDNNTLTPSLSWSAASDNLTNSSDIRYQVRISETQMTGIADALTIGVYKAVSATANSLQLTGLSAGKTYYAVVIAEDRAGNAVMLPKISLSTAPIGVLETISAGTSGTTGPGVAWDLMCSSDSMFIAVQVNTANATYSTDGVSWTKITLPASASWQQVVWNGSVFLLVSRQTTVGLVSSDGISWTQITIPNGDWRGIAALGSKILLMPTQNSTTAKLTTNNGVTWATSTIPPPGMWGMYPSVISDGTRFIAINFANNTSSFISSTDGLNWTTTTMNYTFPGQLYKLGWNGNNYLALISGKLVVSADAINWTEIASPLALGSVNRNNIFSYGHTFVVFAAESYGANPKVAISDSINTTWTNYTLTNQSWPMWVLKGGIVSSINSTKIGIWDLNGLY